MTKVATVSNNFSRGKLDHDLQGRTNLPLYQNGGDVFENFISNYKGNAKNRTGFLHQFTFQDCRYIVFDFSINQNYLCVFYNTEIKFLTFDSNNNFGFVQDGGGDLTVTTPYSLAEAKQLQFTQNADVMVLTHPNHLPQDLTRTSATTFTLTPHTSTGIDFATDGNPSSCAFQDGRLWFGGFQNGTASRPTTMRGSEVADYNQFTVPATIVDSSPINATIAELKQPIKWLFAETTGLIVGNSQNLASLDGGTVGTGITAENVRATITKAEGSNTTYPLNKEGTVFYIGKNNRHFYSFTYDLLEEKFLSDDVNFVSYDITRSGISKLAYKKDIDDLIYTVRDDGKLLTFNFKAQENIAGWHLHSTEGEFKDIVVMPDNLGQQQAISLIKRGSDYCIETQAKYVEFVQQDEFFTDDESADKEAYNRFIAEQLRGCVFLDSAETFNDLQDNSITFNGTDTITATSPVFTSGDIGKQIVYKTETGYEKGRFKIKAFTSDTVVTVDVLTTPTTNTYSDWYLSFDSLSGLTRFNGSTVGIVANGVELGDFDITDGTVDLGEQVENVVIGFRYTCILKSFALGFQVQGQDTNSKKKIIKRAWIRAVTSIGGKFGSSRYALRDWDLGFESGINYLPALPLDGTSDPILYQDNSDIDKVFYIVQEDGTPLTICAVIIEANYEVAV